MYTNNRDAYRAAFAAAWQKHLHKQALEPMESLLVNIILAHPEYHGLLEKISAYQQQEFEPEENPFLHMSLHIAIHEQINMDRPAGVATIYQELLTKYSTPHAVEHQMMQCLAQLMWLAQESGNPPDEADYIEALKKL